MCLHIYLRFFMFLETQRVLAACGGQLIRLFNFLSAKRVRTDFVGTLSTGMYLGKHGACRPLLPIEKFA